MRSYGQYCPIARTLDVVGDRWILLIVRELLLRGPSRYTDLLHGLPGIASNLLSDRLRDLEAAGLIEREAAAPPIATTLYELTERGRALRPVLTELGRWGVPLMADGGEAPTGSRWLTMSLSYFLEDHAPDEPPVHLEIRSGEESITVEVAGGTVRATTDSAVVDALLEGSPELVLGVIAGRTSLAVAREQGLRYEGDVAVLARLQPRAVAAA